MTRIPSVGVGVFGASSMVATAAPSPPGEFRIPYRVGTASSPMAVFFDYKTGGLAVLLFRR